VEDVLGNSKALDAASSASERFLHDIGKEILQALCIDKYPATQDPT